MNLQIKLKTYIKWTVNKIILFYAFIKSSVREICIYIVEKEEKLINFINRYNEYYFKLCAFIIVFTILIQSWDSFIYAFLEMMFWFFMASWILKLYLSLSVEFSLRFMIYFLLILTIIPVITVFKIWKFSITYITKLIYGKN